MDFSPQIPVPNPHIPLCMTMISVSVCREAPLFSPKHIITKTTTSFFRFVARRATRAHRTLYLLFCSCSTRSLTHWEQNCNLKSLGRVLTGAPRTERYRYLDLRGNQILATDMSKYVLCWAELAQLCPHDIVRTSCKASAMQGKKHTCRQECNEISRNLLQAPSLMLS